AFNQSVLTFDKKAPRVFPHLYEENPVHPLKIDCISPKTLRLRLSTGEKINDADSLMLTCNPLPNVQWNTEKKENRVRYSSDYGAVEIGSDPFEIALYDADNQSLTKTYHLHDRAGFTSSFQRPLCYVKRSSDLHKTLAASFTLSPGENIFGCGESFTRLNKRGRKLVLWSTDTYGVQNPRMYKPIPFFMSSRGYGVFVHSSAPQTFDFGHACDEYSTLYSGDGSLDCFIFLGSPKEILREYTALTGRASMPPLWSFGLWMSRVSYKSATEVREVAHKMREYRIPCDVIHIDTDWFAENWRCDYRFAPDRFPDPEKMIRELLSMGIRTTLWQVPYFIPGNALFREIVDKGLAVQGEGRELPTDDAVLDFSNPDTVAWYKEKLRRLFAMGVAAIKADFGEAAPLDGRYASGNSGLFEHNLYPLRYNRAVAEITAETNGDSIIWARSAWAGSQRYPVHWGGDAEICDTAMAASLRGGLSLGLCGFTFWSHDIGGFCRPSPQELYARWLPFGMFTSHSRCHGREPKEPWPYGEEFTALFRRCVRMRYELMPYIYSQAKISSLNGWPMLRTMFFEYPGDPACWLLEDQYMFGSDFLVAPLFESGTESRMVYLPHGQWFDYQTGALYEGGRWRTIGAGEVPVVLLARAGAIIPTVNAAQCTDEIDWSEGILRVYMNDQKTSSAMVYLPDSSDPIELDLSMHDGEKTPSGIKPRLETWECMFYEV
ncbi:MAG: DUF4968 domain-containing protein, partial [Chitinivibrionales bacterium]|nr:DUF4968 domain-containing protein [Chitinivibrionales bacterium]